MTRIFVIAFIISFYYFLGNYIFCEIDKNNELENWQKHAVWWLNIIVMTIWPIVAILYIIKRPKK